LGGYLVRPQRDEVAALVGIAALLRAQLATHVAFELMDRRGLSTPDDVERDCLMGAAAEALDLEVTQH
jgi:hypothetical protein